MSEQSSYLQSQAIMDISANSTISMSWVQTDQSIKPKPRFAEFTCSFNEVRNIIFGWNRNMSLIDTGVAVYISGNPHSDSERILGFREKFRVCNDMYVIACIVLCMFLPSSTDVKEFIQCRRFENMSLHYLMQGFSSADCDWLATPGSGKATRVAVSDTLKRKELLEDFLFWYFDSFVLSLLKVRKSAQLCLSF
jgi:hypothetical protein